MFDEYSPNLGEEDVDLKSHDVVSLCDGGRLVELPTTKLGGQLIFLLLEFLWSHNVPDRRLHQAFEGHIRTHLLL